MTAWSVKGVDQATRDIARRAAGAAGMTIGEWIDHAIRADAANRGIAVPAVADDPGRRAVVPAEGISADTAEAIFSRIEDGEQLFEARLRPIGFALKDVAERLVALERQASTSNQTSRPAIADRTPLQPIRTSLPSSQPAPSGVAPTAERPGGNAQVHDLVSWHPSGRDGTDQRDIADDLPDAPPSSWRPPADIDGADLARAAGAPARPGAVPRSFPAAPDAEADVATRPTSSSEPRPEPIPPTQDFDADPIDIRALGLEDEGIDSTAATVRSAARRPRRAARAALIAASLVILGVAGALSWSMARDGDLTWDGLTARVAAVPPAAERAVHAGIDWARNSLVDLGVLQGPTGTASLPASAPSATEPPPSDSSSEPSSSEPAPGSVPGAAPGPVTDSGSQPGGHSRGDGASLPLDDTVSADTKGSAATSEAGTVARAPDDSADRLAQKPGSDPVVPEETQSAPAVEQAPGVVDPRPVSPPPAPALAASTVGQRTGSAGVAADSTGSRSGTGAAPTRSRAEAGDPAAQFAIAAGLMNASPPSPAEAATWFREAAINGLAVAQFNLGAMYETGIGAPRDETRALLWYHSAAEQGFAPAQYNLGRLYAEGRGIPQSNTEAGRWFRRAAEGGLADGLHGLAVLSDDVADRERLMSAAAEAENEAARAWLRGRSQGAGPEAVLGPPAALVLNAPSGAADIAEIQQALKDRGYYEGDVDGIAGPMTRAAISRFQADTGLPQTGLPSASLRQSLN